jgi:outer membrane protein TolC
LTRLRFASTSTAKASDYETRAAEEDIAATRSAGIGVSQLITDFGRTDALVEASQSAFEAKRQRAELSRAAVILGVTRAYYDALRAQALVKVARDTLKTRQTLLNQVTSLRLTCTKAVCEPVFVV